MKVTFRQSRHRNQDRLQWEWTLSGDNNEPIARSTESYDNEGDMVAAFEMVTDTTVKPNSMVAAGAPKLGNPPRGRRIDVVWERAE